MAEYLILIHEDEKQYAAGGEQVYGEVYQAHVEFSTKHGAVLRGGHALTGESDGKIVRDGVVTDGPFAETKEALGGFYVVEADDLDAAVEIAKDVPARFGFVSVRPVQVFD